MDWILDHLKLVVFAVSALAYWINQRRAARGPVPPSQSAKKYTQPSDGLDNDERVRRVQEEIRRRIMERSGAGPVVKEPLQAPFAELRRLPPRLPKPAEPQPVAQTPIRNEDEVLAQQRKIAEEFRALATKRAQIERAADNVVESGRLRSEAGWLAAETKLMSDLRDPASLRRAIIMREVLGPPVGLR